ncbi:MAG TPA: hypothetical protein VK402_07655 [Blastococcus sp.]|nr:hypothetical protein [Blastococcus sp.]
MRTSERTTSTWTRLAASAALAGGVAWLLKQVAIAATLRPDGQPSEGLLIGVLYLLGAALLVVGASGVVARLTPAWPIAVRVGLAVVLAPAIFWGVFTGADALVDALAGPDAGWWWPSEGAIVVTALLFAAAGATALVSARRPAAIVR